MAAKKQTVVIVEAKTELGKTKIGYHGNRWYLRGEVENLKFYRAQGPSIVVRSRDGSKILFIKKQDDPNLSYRIL